MEQLIHLKAGEFKIDKGFIVSGKTQREELLAHFEGQSVSVNDFNNGYCNYSVRNLKIGEWYFILTFCYFHEAIKKIEILVQTESYDTGVQSGLSDDSSGWDNFDEKEEIKKGKYMEQWMAKQMQRDYKKYDWGKAGVNYDFHNLSSSCFMEYYLTQNS